MEYKTGTLVEFRSRPWVVQQSSDKDLLVIKPLGGTDAETVGLYKPLYGDKLDTTVSSYNFRKPSAEDVGTNSYPKAARILYNACRLSFRDIAGPFQCLGRLSFEPRPYQMVPLILALKHRQIRLLISDDVGIGKDIVATNYILTYTKESVSYRLESLFLLKSEQRAPSTKRISTLEILANTTDEQIKAYEVYKQLIEYGSMKFGDTEITINVSNKKVLLSTINKQLSNLNIHKAVLDILNIKTPINYKTFTGKDNFSMRQLYKALIEHKAIGLTNPQNMFKISIANINVLLVCQSDNREKFYIDNAFTSSIEVIQNNDVTPFRVPIFSFLEQKGYVLFDNIPYDRIVEVYNECYIKDSRVLIQANLDLLHMLKAYDELKMSDNLEKSKFTIEVAQSLAQWLLKHERDNSMIAIHQLNILQIIKRQRTFTKNEVNLLLQLSQNNSDMVKAGAFLLLDKLDVAQFVIQQFPEDMKARFMDFPIAIFVKAPNCCNN